MKKQLISSLIRIFTIVFTALLLLTLCMNLATLRAVGEIRRGGRVQAGYFLAIVDSGSMEPTVSVNDLLLLESRPVYHEKDVITFVTPKGMLVTHRVTAVTGGGYITQGDANNIPDGEIRAQRVLGRVFCVVPRIGGLTDGIFSPVGILLMVNLGILALLVHWLRRAKDEA